MQQEFGGAENVVKTETANIRKWIARFYTLNVILRWKRVAIITLVHELPIDMGNSICTAR